MVDFFMRIKREIDEKDRLKPWPSNQAKKGGQTND